MTLARVPLFEVLENRDSSFDKDGFSSNVFYDKDDNTTYATKRPGITTNAFGIGAGLGIYFFDNEVFLFQDVEAINWGVAEVGNDILLIKERFSSTPHSNRLLYTSSPINFNATALPVDWSFTGLAFGAGVFVASVLYQGSGQSFPVTTKYFYSTNGTDWLETNAVGPTDALVFLNSRFLAIGTSSSVAKYSTDGISWTNYTGSQVAPKSTVTWNGTVYCDASANPGFAIIVRTSPDAFTWTTQTGIAGAHNTIDGIASNTTTGTMVIAERSNDVYYSTNSGVSWTAVTLPTISSGDEVRQIRYVNSLFITLTDAGGVHSSANGITWTFKGYITGAPSTGFGTFAYLNGTYVVIYTQVTATLPESNWYYYSTDLVTWTLDTLQEAQLPTIY